MINFSLVKSKIRFWKYYNHRNFSFLNKFYKNIGNFVLISMKAIEKDDWNWLYCVFIFTVMYIFLFFYSRGKILIKFFNSILKKYLKYTDKIKSSSFRRWKTIFTYLLFKIRYLLLKLFKWKYQMKWQILKINYLR